MGYIQPVTPQKKWAGAVHGPAGLQRIRDTLAPLLGVEVSEAGLKDLQVYLEQTLLWGEKVDLVAARGLGEFLDLSLTDAALMARVELERGARGDTLVDVGTGGGAPGIPLAILLHHLRGQLRTTLVEPRTKRVAFLRSVTGQLAASPVTVLRCRSNAVISKEFDVACARATLPPSQWLEEGARLARKAVWVLLAKEEPPSQSCALLDADLSYVWPHTQVGRRAVRYVLP